MKYRYTDTATIDRSLTTLEDLDDILEKARELGEATVVEESPGRISGFTFTIEAEDLWDLREMVDENYAALDRMWEGLSLDRPDKSKVIQDA